MGAKRHFGGVGGGRWEERSGQTDQSVDFSDGDCGQRKGLYIWGGGAKVWLCVWLNVCAFTTWPGSTLE